MDINEIFKPRYGGAQDPDWQKYHQWPWDYFPINLPACTVTRRQRELEREDACVIVWEVERGIPVVCRFDDSEGKILAELLPAEVSQELDGEAFEPDFHIRRESFAAESLTGLHGFSFEWVFKVPLKPAGQFQPSHPLGVVRVEAAELVGKETTLTIVAGGRLKPRSKDLLMSWQEL